MGRIVVLNRSHVLPADYCGSTIIDKRFEDFVRKRIHGYDIPEKPLNDLMNEFVKRKEEFEDSEEEPTQHIGPLPPSLVSRLNGNGIFHSKASKDDNFVAISRLVHDRFPALEVPNLDMIGSGC